MDHSSSSASAVHHGVQLLMTNQFESAQQFFIKHSEEDAQVALLQSMLAYLNAISSHSDSQLSDALTMIWKCEKQGRALAATKHQSSKEIEGILIQADTHILAAMIQFLQQSYIKAAWNIRKSYQFYHQAQQKINNQEELLKTHQKEQEEEKKQEDEENEDQENEDDVEDDDSSSMTSSQFSELRGWSEFGVGMFNLFLSLLPPTILKVVQTIGYSGDRDYGLKLLKHSQTTKSFIAPFSSLLLLSYFLTISTFTAVEDPSFLPQARELLDWAAVRYPNGAFFALMESRYYRAAMQPRKAIEVAQAGLTYLTELPAIAVMFHYQSGWCALFLLSWGEAARSFDALLHSTPGGDYVPPVNSNSPNHLPLPISPSSLSIPPTKASAQSLYAYQCGLCYAMLGDFDRARWYMEGVPSWLSPQRKPIDIYATNKAAIFLQRKPQQTDEILLDMLELIICWNGLSQMTPESLQQCQTLLQTAKQRQQQQQQQQQSSSETETSSSLHWSRDDLIRCQWIEACLLELTSVEQSAAVLTSIIQEHSAFLETSRHAAITGVLPWIYYELAQCQLALNNTQSSKDQVHKANKYHKYDLYNILQLKLHALEQKIKRQEKLHKETATRQTSN